jgi:hypothetical protein
LDCRTTAQYALTQSFTTEYTIANSSPFRLCARASKFISHDYIVVAWFLAPEIAKLITARNDASITVEPLSLRDLLTTGFACLGLYFILKSIGRVFVFLYNAAIFRASNRPSFPSQELSYEQLIDPGITIFAGIFVIVNCRRLANKVCLGSAAVPPVLPAGKTSD